jgi:hypothetical protein
MPTKSNPPLRLGQRQGLHTKNTKNTFAKFHELSPSTTPQLVDLCVERNRKLVIKVIEHEGAMVEHRKTIALVTIYPHSTCLNDYTTIDLDKGWYPE